MEKLEIYNNIANEALKCNKCELGCGLLDGQDPHVMGQGNLNASVMFMAEAPGEQETIYHRPLTPPGVSGELYEKILDHIGLKRDDVYTCNTLICRPPKNADPEPYQLKMCKQYLDKQIDLIKPKLIVTFGRFAAQVFINDFKITRDHGKSVYSKNYNADIFPLFHPAYVKAYAPLKNREAFKKDINVLRDMVKKYKGV